MGPEPSPTGAPSPRVSKTTPQQLNTARMLSTFSATSSMSANATLMKAPPIIKAQERKKKGFPSGNSGISRTAIHPAMGIALLTIGSLEVAAAAAATTSASFDCPFASYGKRKSPRQFDANFFVSGGLGWKMVIGGSRAQIGCGADDGGPVVCEIPSSKRFRASSPNSTRLHPMDLTMDGVSPRDSKLRSNIGRECKQNTKKKPLRSFGRIARHEGAIVSPYCCSQKAERKQSHETSIRLSKNGTDYPLVGKGDGNTQKQGEQRWEIVKLKDNYRLLRRLELDERIRSRVDLSSMPLGSKEQQEQMLKDFCRYLREVKGSEVYDDDERDIRFSLKIDGKKKTLVIRPRKGVQGCEQKARSTGSCIAQAADNDNASSPPADMQSGLDAARSRSSAAGEERHCSVLPIAEEFFDMLIDDADDDDDDDDDNDDSGDSAGTMIKGRIIQATTVSSTLAPVHTTTISTVRKQHHQQKAQQNSSSLNKKNKQQQGEERYHREQRKKEKDRHLHQSQKRKNKENEQNHFEAMMNTITTNVTKEQQQHAVVTENVLTAHKKWPLSRVALQGKCFQHVCATMLSFLSTKERHVVQRVCKMWASRFSFSKTTTLNLSGVYTLTNQQFIKLVGLYPSLKTVSLRGCRRLTDNALKTLADTQSKSVVSVDLSRMPKISDDGLRLLESCQDLQKLSIASCANITKGGVQTLARKCPKLVPPIIVPTLTRQRGIYWMQTSQRPLEPMPSPGAATTATTTDEWKNSSSNTGGHRHHDPYSSAPNCGRLPLPTTDMMIMMPQSEKASSPPEEELLLHEGFLKRPMLVIGHPAATRGCAAEAVSCFGDCFSLCKTAVLYQDYWLRIS
eukprot:jgi/Bigna1/85623/estExt_fgenesh1_pg.C_50071